MSPLTFFLDRIGNYTTSHSIEYVSAGDCFGVALALPRNDIPRNDITPENRNKKKSWVICVHLRPIFFLTLVNFYDIIKKGLCSSHNYEIHKNPIGAF
jgi:hypothetical protein